MGTYYSYGATRKDVIAEQTPEKRTQENGGTFETLRHCCKGNVLYALHRTTAPDGTSKKWICLYLLTNGGSDGWGYKPIDETMGPYYYLCPVSYLDAADEPMSDTAAEWRAEVRKQAAAKKVQNAKKPQPGEYWSLLNCALPHVKIVSAKPLRGSYNYTTYKIKKKQVGEKIDPPN